jgi:hypothetical protein
LKIFRELADLLGTHRAIEDLKGALLNHALVARGLSNSVLAVLAKQLEAEMSDLETTVVDNQP